MRYVLALCLVLMVGCEGPMGPEGPRGPSGEAGPPGPGSRLTYSGTLDSQGNVVEILPGEAGSTSEPPALTCYISSSESAWLSVDDGTTTCGLATGASGLAAVIVNGPPFWMYRFVVVY